MADGEMQGTCSEQFTPVQEELAARLVSGDELGASIVITVDGEVVADMWGGFRDEARSTPWTADTIVNVWSTTKTVTNLAALMLVDRGLLDPHAPVARGHDGGPDTRYAPFAGPVTDVLGLFR